jgi:hypothetical protein
VLTTDRLAAVDDDRLTRLGFRADDRRDLRSAVERVLADPARLAVVDQLAERLRKAVGAFDSDVDVFGVSGADDDALGVGVLPTLALVATADDVADFHRRLGIDEEVSRASLSDLGQQAWVHRRTYGAFGMHTYGWMRIAWSGALYWLGRLQFNISRFSFDDTEEWVLSTHIPESGPLTPDRVADSFVRARSFFATHFSDYPTKRFHCHSWLLDPQLTEVLPADSNMSRFQQLWQLHGEGRDGDGDAMFFVFRRRGEVDHATLPQDTTLQRAIVAKLAAGGHWYTYDGTFDQERIG